MRRDICTQLTQTFSAVSFPSLQTLAVGLLLAMLSSLPARSIAHSFSLGECKEASDFVKNAALARDNGTPETIFIDRIRDNLEIMRELPPQLRLLVQDDDDAKLLLTASENVFQHPKSAHAHQIEFFNGCIDGAKATSSMRKIGM